MRVRARLAGLQYTNARRYFTAPSAKRHIIKVKVKILTFFKFVVDIDLLRLNILMFHFLSGKYLPLDGPSALEEGLISHPQSIQI